MSIFDPNSSDHDKPYDDFQIVNFLIQVGHKKL